MAAVFLKLGIAALVAYVVWKAVPWFGSRRRRMISKHIQIYFNTHVYPQDELPPHIRKLESNLWPPKKTDEEPEFKEYEEEELSSDYYLRTRQRVSLEYPGWYGAEAWIRDIVAGKADPEKLCDPLYIKENLKEKEDAGNKR